MKAKLMNALMCVAIALLILPIWAAIVLLQHISPSRFFAAQQESPQLTATATATATATVTSIPANAEAIANPEKQKIAERWAELVPELSTACKLSPGISCHMMAHVYLEGYTGVVDTVEARRLMTRSCAGLEADSCLKLWTMHLEGIGGPVDTAMAEFYLEQACGLQNATACGHLAAKLALEDNTLEADLYRGYHLMAQLCENNEGNSCELLEKIKTHPIRMSIIQRWEVEMTKLKKTKIHAFEQSHAHSDVDQSSQGSAF